MDRIEIKSLKLYKQLKDIFGDNRYILVPNLIKKDRDEIEVKISYVDIYSLSSGFKVHQRKFG